jgi:deoxyribose-phosphate aldolase
MAEVPAELVSKVVEAVVAELKNRGAAAPAAPAAAPAPAACTLAHGMAAAPPAKAPAPAPKDALVAAGAHRIGHSTESAAPPDAALCRPLAGYIDHTLLKQDATDEQVEALCEQAREFQFASVCVNPSYVPLCAGKLQGSGVKVCTVVGFPLGATTTATKVFEAREAVAHGADEIDMVIHIGKLKAGDFEYVCSDIRAVVHAAQGRVVKVILETTLLTDEEKVAGCILSKAGGADFVKTSTGFAGGGATAEDVALMRKVVGSDLGVKASGGIRTCDDAARMVAAGANRLGASASVAIIGGKGAKGSGY